MVHAAGSGHAGGALGAADVLTVLWWRYLRHRPAEPDWPQRDRFILSNGHICPLLYAVLADCGYFSRERLKTLRKLGSELQGHPSITKGPPGVEYSGGSLGNGLSFALGTALAGRMDEPGFRVFCMISDGESQEGQVWEAAMATAHYGVDNLTVILDRNNCQIDGPNDTIMSLEPVVAKWKAFGWHVLEVDGHDYAQLGAAFDEALATAGKPTIIIANTVLGKGVDFMEGDYQWHHGAPSGAELNDALRQLGKAGAD
jgi:transketolase